jgi:hypothetical protein
VPVDHEKQMKPAEASNRVFGNPVAKMRKVGIAAQVAEGQHSDRRTLARPFGGSHGRRRGQAIGEDVSVEVFGLSVRLNLEILLQSLAQSRVELQRLSAVALQRKQTHEGAVDRLPQLIAGE